MIKEYLTQKTCSRKITIDYDPAAQIINSVKFEGGCPGNTAGVAKLVAGKKIADVIELLQGTDCRGKGTSCPDQLARALRECR